MNIIPLTQLEERLRRQARSFIYPRTPDLSRAVHRRIGESRVSAIRLAVRVAAIALVIIAAALAVPQVRAKLVELFQMGAVRVFPTAPGEIPPPTAITPRTEIPLTATPRVGYPEPEYVVSVIGLAGETTLEVAQAQVSFPIRMPGYPSDLGAPDRVFLQKDGPMVILAWLDPADPQKVRLSLHEIGSEGVYVSKYEPRVIQQAQVNGQDALWVQGPYLVDLTTGEQVFRRLVKGNTLIWIDGDLTYRLETDLPLAETIKIAESLQ